MVRFLLYVVASLVSGTGAAIVLSLMTTALVAATAKSRAGIDTAVYQEVKPMAEPVFQLILFGRDLSPTWIHLTALAGYIVGFVAMAFLFYGKRRPGPTEPAPDGRSEV